MANITKRTNKKGELSFLIRVYAGEKMDGKQSVHAKTYKPPVGMGERKARKEAEKVATLFEEEIRKGTVFMDGNLLFHEYAAHWLETAHI